MRKTSTALWMMLSLSAMATTANAGDFAKSDMLGKWCYHQHVYAGSTEPESVDVNFMDDGKYTWIKGSWDFSGTWELNGAAVTFSERTIGDHTLIALADGKMEMEGRYGVMYFKSGECH